MRFQCPRCDGSIDAEAGWIGLETSCPHCQEPIAVPEPKVLKLPSPPSSSSNARPAESVLPHVRIKPQGHPTSSASTSTTDSKGGLLDSLNSRIDNFLGSIPIPSQFRPKVLLLSIGAITLLFLLTILFSDPTGTEPSSSSTDSYPTTALYSAPSLQESRERMSDSLASDKPCLRCSGSGQATGSDKCWRCWGAGTTKTPSGYTTVCSGCSGSGKLRERCSVCNGSGTTRRR